MGTRETSSLISPDDLSNNNLISRVLDNYFNICIEDKSHKTTILITD